MITKDCSSEEISSSLSVPAREELLFHVELRIKEIMNKKIITIAQMARISGLRYETVKNYYHDEIYMMDKEVLAVFCAVLKCDISDLLVLIYNDKSGLNEKVKFKKSLEKVLV